jgi:hypothetical protein
MYGIKYSAHRFNMRSHGASSFYPTIQKIYIYKKILKVMFNNKPDELLRPYFNITYRNSRLAERREYVNIHENL